MDRSRIIRAIGWEDYAALITLPFCIAYGTLLGVSTRYGMGLHAWDFPGDLREQYQKWIFIASCTYLPSLLGYKMSILFLYLRIFNVDRIFRYCTWAAMFVTFGYLFSNFWTLIFGCQPIAKYWDPETPGHCIFTLKADYGYGSLNFITDHAHLSRKERVGVSVIFMIGSVNWAVAIVRFVCAVRDLTSEDRPWLAAETFLWSIIEVNTGLICACVPVLKPFFKHVVPKSVTDRSWSFGWGKVSPTGDALEDERKYSDRLWDDLERGKAGSLGTSASSSIG
ncbi:hypothetical protein HO173_005983 [Letharia columbiana]|uniref:Rhodopsin domain-containing protein n=1 Tax=Letharia columbiana TaxID=112416 RepID=A0A8H6L522_9LECA|nr:uncharacterized protein HO173_005983 [Letharia columbiana]KAF6235788.1 hypothetical protein HO173_005983 [Letharia columbiana]